MKRFLCAICVGFLSIVVFTSAGYALPVNLGFEEGNLSGWDAGPNASVVSSYATSYSHAADMGHETYSAPDGDYFMMMEWDNGDGAFAETSPLLTFTLNPGETVEGWLAVGAQEGALAAIHLMPIMASDFLISASATSPTSGATTPWVHWEYEAVEVAPGVIPPFDLTVEGFGAGSGYVLFDVKVTSAVPEPGTLLLLGIGFIGLGGLRRRNKR